MSEAPPETSTRYDRPYRPALIRAANGLGRLVAPVGLRARLSPRSLLASARRRNRLDDFGEPRVEEPLARLVTSIEAEAALHPVGRLLTRERLLGLLGNRLRAQHWLSAHPEVAERAVAPLLVVTGLQRTGTTLLHRLLAADPETRSLTSWEALNPAPLLPRGRGTDDGAPPRNAGRRRRLARRAERALAYMAPDFFAIHPVEADGTEEDSLLLDLSLLSPVAEATLRVPSYAEWLAGQDMTPAYRFLERMLQLLQWQRPARRWVLKTPAHLPFLDVLFDVFPDVRIIQTHRHPRTTLASYCSMIAHGRGVFSDRIDPDALGRELLDQQSGMVRAALDARRDPRLDEVVLDVAYRDLIRDPLEAVRRIHAFAGLELTREAESAMRALLRVQTQHRYGRHRYALEAFGLGEGDVERAFAPYLARHFDARGSEEGDAL